MASALDGVRVLDLTSGIAGPLGVLMLAEHGADVVKVEPPGGDPFRAYEGTRVWNRSRRSVTVDLKAQDGQDAFRRLVATTDLVVESFRPGVMDRLGWGYDAIAAVNPRAILLSVPAYPAGHRMASRPGYDALVQAASGQMWEQPGWRPGPVFLHMPMPSMGAFYLVAIGATAALLARERTGRGQHVETSLLQGALLYTTQIWQEVERAPAAFHELMGKSYPPGIHQTSIFECAGREWLHISTMSGLAPKATLDAVLGLDDGSGGERQRARMKEWKRAELIEALRAADYAVEAIDPPGSMFDHPQSVANGMVATVVDPEVGETTQMGVPIHLLGTPGAIQGPQPRPGEHTAEVLAEARPAPAATPTPATAARADAPLLALGDVRVIDFGQFLAGPFGPMILGDLGADVVKVEPPRGDGMRLATKPFFGCQRGKRSVALDLKSPQGLDAAQRLIAGADVVHHNMTRGVATRLGIDYEACRALRPDVVYCNTYAYGLPDPLGRFGGLDPLFQASAGLEYEAGATHTGNQPLYYRFGMTDASNALLSTVGVLLALVHRARTGEGQELWTSLLDGGMVFSSDVWLDASGRPWDRPRLDRDLMGISPLYRLYRTQDDGWIVVAALTDADWQALCRAVGREDLLDDPRFADAAGRSRGDGATALAAELEAAFRTRTAVSWTRRLDEAGVPNEVPVDTLEGRLVLHDADNVRLGLVAEYEHPVMGLMRQFGRLVAFSETPGRITGPPPLVGQHTREVLREAGLRDGDVDALVAAGVAYEPDEGYRERFGA